MNSLNATLLTCCHDRLVSMIPALLKRGADANVQNKNGNNALHLLFCEVLEPDIPKAGWKPAPPLAKEAFMYRRAVKALIEHGLDPYAVNRMHMTAFDGIRSVPSVELLCEDLEIKAPKGSLSDLIHHVRHSSDINLCIKHGADVDHLDELGRSPLVCSILKSDARWCQRLIDAGANIHQRYLGKSLLYHCTQGGLTAFLLQKGVVPNNGDFRGVYRHTVVPMLRELSRAKKDGSRNCHRLAWLHFLRMYAHHSQLSAGSSEYCRKRCSLPKEHPMHRSPCEACGTRPFGERLRNMETFWKVHKSILASSMTMRGYEGEPANNNVYGEQSWGRAQSSGFASPKYDGDSGGAVLNLVSPRELAKRIPSSPLSPRPSSGSPNGFTFSSESKTLSPSVSKTAKEPFEAPYHELVCLFLSVVESFAPLGVDPSAITVDGMNVISYCLVNSLHECVCILAGYGADLDGGLLNDGLRHSKKYLLKLSSGAERKNNSKGSLLAYVDKHPLLLTADWSIFLFLLCQGSQSTSVADMSPLLRMCVTSPPSSLVRTCTGLLLIQPAAVYALFSPLDVKTRIEGLERTKQSSRRCTESEQRTNMWYDDEKAADLVIPEDLLGLALRTGRTNIARMMLQAVFRCIATDYWLVSGDEAQKMQDEASLESNAQDADGNVRIVRRRDPSKRVISSVAGLMRSFDPLYCSSDRLMGYARDNLSYHSTLMQRLTAFYKVNGKGLMSDKKEQGERWSSVASSPVLDSPRTPAFIYRSHLYWFFALCRVFPELQCSRSFRGLSESALINADAGLIRTFSSMFCDSSLPGVAPATIDDMAHWLLGAVCSCGNCRTHLCTHLGAAVSCRACSTDSGSRCKLRSLLSVSNSPRVIAEVRRKIPEQGNAQTFRRSPVQVMSSAFKAFNNSLQLGLQRVPGDGGSLRSMLNNVFSRHNGEQGGRNGDGSDESESGSRPSSPSSRPLRETESYRLSKMEGNEQVTFSVRMWDFRALLHAWLNCKRYVYGHDRESDESQCYRLLELCWDLEVSEMLLFLGFVPNAHDLDGTVRSLIPGLRESAQQLQDYTKTRLEAKSEAMLRPDLNDHRGWVEAGGGLGVLAWHSILGPSEPHSVEDRSRLEDMTSTALVTAKPRKKVQLPICDDCEEWIPRHLAWFAHERVSHSIWLLAYHGADLNVPALPIVTTLDGAGHSTVTHKDVLLSAACTSFTLSNVLAVQALLSCHVDVNVCTATRIFKSKKAAIGADETEIVIQRSDQNVENEAEQELEGGAGLSVARSESIGAFKYVSRPPISVCLENFIDLLDNLPHALPVVTVGQNTRAVMPTDDAPPMRARSTSMMQIQHGQSEEKLWAGYFIYGLHLDASPAVLCATLCHTIVLSVVSKGLSVFEQIRSNALDTWITNNRGVSMREQVESGLLAQDSIKASTAHQMGLTLFSLYTCHSNLQLQMPVLMAACERGQRENTLRSRHIYISLLTAAVDRRVHDHDSGLPLVWAPRSLLLWQQNMAKWAAGYDLRRIGSEGWPFPGSDMLSAPVRLSDILLECNEYARAQLLQKGGRGGYGTSLESSQDSYDDRESSEDSSDDLFGSEGRLGSMDPSYRRWLVDGSQAAGRAGLARSPKASTAGDAGGDAILCGSRLSADGISAWLALPKECLAGADRVFSIIASYLVGDGE